ncbi:hypothetical protein JTB14_000327 [Gonioctena quinquepunctata]|nr:hypothetical protein JTB14_000327 [Gonioctena quinquepunctata]
MPTTKVTFADIHDISLTLKNTNYKNIVENVHFLLYGEPPKAKAVKRKITAFSGYPFQDNSRDSDGYLILISESLSIKNLQKLCKFFSKYTKTAFAYELARMLIKILWELLRDEDSTQSHQEDDIKASEDQ